MPETSVVTRFYEAFASKDAVGMAACYHPSATFEDPAFGPLDHDAACAMWAMLLSRSTDLTVTHRILSQEGDSVQARWEARYTFVRTGRPVLNRIEASFILKDGLILSHRDQFPFWPWARQAFGLTGLLLGWLPWFQSKVRAQALQTLAAYRAKVATP